jgi:hypothetical protein
MGRARSVFEGGAVHRGGAICEKQYEPGNNEYKISACGSGFFASER